MNRTLWILPLLLLGGCRDTLPTDLTPSLPTAAISDGSNSGGNVHFHWLPPLVSETSYSGTFDGSLSPVVEICELAGTTCSSDPLVKTFSMTHGSGSELIRSDASAEHYIVNWHTGRSHLDSSKTYRISVSVAGSILGYADARVIRPGDRGPRAPEFVWIPEKQTLPIKFRVEKGAVFVLGTSGGTATAAEGAVLLKFRAGSLEDEIGVTVQPIEVGAGDENIVAGAVYEFGPSPYTFEDDVTLTLTYDESLVPAGSEDLLRLFKKFPDGWRELPGSSVNTTSNVVSGPIKGFSIIGAGVTQAPGDAVATNWALQRQALTGDNINGVWSATSNDLFAVGGGTILRYSGGGWRRMFYIPPMGQFPNLRAVWGTSSSNVFAVGSRGTIMRFDGTSWQAQNSGTQEQLNAVWGASDSEIYAVGERGTIVRFDGTTWSPMPSNAPTISGSPAHLNGVWGIASGNVYAVGVSGTVLRYDGSTWSPVTTNTSSQTHHGIWGSSAGDIFIVGHQAIVHYDGSQWTERMTDPVFAGSLGAGQQTAIWGTGPDDVFAVGERGRVLHYDGSDWSRIPSGSTQFLWGISGSGSADVVAVGEEGTILRWSGSSWRTENFGPRLVDVWGSSESNVYAVGARGSVLHYNGSVWAAVPTGIDENISGIWGSSADNIYATAGYGGILRYNGSSWSRMYGGQGSGLLQLNGIWGAHGAHVWAVGGGGTILLYDGAVWRKMISNAPVAPFGGAVGLNDVWGSSVTNVFAVGEGGTILRFNGHTWNQMVSNAPIPPGWPAATTLTGIWGSSATDIYAVGWYGTILHFDGAAWTPVNLGTSTSFNEIWGTSATNIYAVGGNEIWHFDGTVWTRLTQVNGQLLAVWGTGSTVLVTGEQGIIMRGTP